MDGNALMSSGLVQLVYMSIVQWFLSFMVDQKMFLRLLCIQLLKKKKKKCGFKYLQIILKARMEVDML